MLNADLMNSDALQNYTLGVSNGYIELRNGGAAAVRLPRLGFSGLTVEEALRVLVGRYEAGECYCGG